MNIHTKNESSKTKKIVAIIFLSFSLIKADELRTTPLLRYKKITIIGRPGSGKSRLAHMLQKATGLPLFHVDKITHVPNWNHRPTHDYMKEIEKIIQDTSWILEGNTLETVRERFAHSELVIYLNSSCFACYWNIFMRYLFPPDHIDDIPSGATERPSLKLITSMWHFDTIFGPTIAECRKKYPQVDFYEIKNRQELKNFQQLFKIKSLSKN